MLIHLLLQVSEDDIAKVNEEYNLDDVKIKDYINIINIWCNKQDHLVEAHKYMTPDVITRLIIISRGKVEETKAKIDRLMTMRAMLPEVILNKSYEEFENLLENVIFIPMPKLDVSKSRIMIAKYCNPDRHVFDTLSYVRYTFMIGEFRLYVDYNISDIHILDLKGLTLNDVAQFNPIIFRKGEILHAKGYGLRVKGIHILNAPTYADKFISVLKTVLSEKVAGRIHVHNSYDDLHKYIPKAFLPEDYGGEEPSIAVIHGYGNIAPRTILGKGVTIVYALFGIPLTLIYLSSVGSLLSKMARSVFSRALCCCLCSNCGYCCYDERRMAGKERRMKLKRQQEEILNSQNTSKTPTEECYVLKTDSQKDSSISERPTTSTAKDDIISWPDTDSKVSMHGLSILAPVLLCLAAIFIYITFGAIVLLNIDNMGIVDGFYFCFMALSTIGFGNIIPGMSYTTINGVRYYTINSTVLWFCSAYTLTGLALTAMCFGVIHDEIIYRIKHQQKEWSQKSNIVNDEVNISEAYYMTS